MTKPKRKTQICREIDGIITKAYTATVVLEDWNELRAGGLLGGDLPLLSYQGHILFCSICLYHTLLDHFMTTPAADRDHLNLPSPYWIPSNVSNSLNHDHITTALKLSPDGGETLVFSKLDLTDISVDALEELATRVGEDGEGAVKRSA